MIVPKTIAGYTGYRWPDDSISVSAMSYIEGTVDKVWITSSSELGDGENEYNSSSEDSSSTAFEYFKNFQLYKNPYNNLNNVTLNSARAGIRSSILNGDNNTAGNYSIPIYCKGTTAINTDIHGSMNSSNTYWTRTSASNWSAHMRMVDKNGACGSARPNNSNFGVRPCIILKY